LCDEGTWKLIKQDYISTDVSLMDLSRKYGVPKGTIGKRASEEKWRQKRERRVEKTETKLIEMTSGKNANALYATVMAADALSAKLHALVDRISDASLVTDLRGVESIAKALRYLQQVQMVGYGLLEPGPAQRIQLERDRIALEQERIKREAGAGDAAPILIAMPEGVDPGE